MIIRRKPLNRRTVLKGMLGGAAVSIALPSLKLFSVHQERPMQTRRAIRLDLEFSLGAMVCIPSIGFRKKQGPILI